MKEKKILVTGADGFIGSHLIRALSALDINYKIKVIQNTEKSSPIDTFKDSLEILKGDLMDSTFCSKVFRDVDIVIHLAGFKKNLSYHNRNPAKVFDINARIDLNVMKACSENKVQTLLYASTAALYDFKDGPIDEDGSLCINHTNPDSIPNYGYVLSKFFGEQLGIAYSKESSINMLICRFDNTFGEGDNFGEYAQIIPRFVNDALSNQRIELFGDGSARRTFIYVEDLVTILLNLLAKSEGQQGYSVFNLSSSEVISIRDLATIISKKIGGGVEIRFHKDNIQDIQSLSKSRIISNGRLHQHIGKIDYHPMETALEKTIEWRKYHLKKDK